MSQLQKKVYIVHGDQESPNDHWFPWLKKQLENKSFQVEVPVMPETDYPTLDKWLSHIQNLIGVCDEDTYLVGHSLGTITALRFLEALPNNQRAGGVVLVAGFSEPLGFKPLSSFTEKPLDYKKVKNSVNPAARGGASKIVVIHSTDDESVPYKFAEILRDKLGAELITLHNSGHINSEDGYFELPQALDAILKFSNE